MVVSALQALRWLVQPQALLDGCARAHGDVFTLRLGGVGRVLVVADPTSIRRVFTAPAGQLEPRQASEVFRPFVGDRSLLLLEGDAHLRRRRLVQPALHGRHVRGVAATAIAAVADVTRSWSPGTRVRALDLARDISLRVVIEGVLGVRGAERRARTAELARLIFGSTLTTLAFLPPLRRDLGAWSPWGRFSRLRAELEAILLAEIGARRDGGPEALDDVLGALVHGKDAEGRGLSDAELVDELMTLLFAGHDTTSTSLAWAWNRVLLDEDLARAVGEEAASFADPATADATTAPLVDAVCQETLRLHPPVPLVMRGVCEATTVAGHRVDRGDLVAAAVHLAHRRAATFADPLRFRPERFVERSYSPYEYLPFGGGVRRCVGMALALHVMRVALVATAARARLRLGSPRLSATARRAGTLVARDGCPMVVASLRR